MIQLSIFSRQGALFQGEVHKVDFPGLQGRFQVFKGHAPLIALLTLGEIKYRVGEGDSSYVSLLLVKEGVVKVSTNRVDALILV